MIQCETFVNAQVHTARGALVCRCHTVGGLVAAVGTVSLLLGVNKMMIFDERHRSVGSSTCLHCLPIGPEQMHQRVHELFSEIKLLRPMLANRPELEGIDDAHINEPPC